AGAARLGDLVLVVWEDEVEAAAVDLEDGPEMLLGHRGALDVPARPPGPPRRVPQRVLALLVPLPEREVARVLLQRALLLFLRWVADRLLVEAAGQDAVVGVAVDAVVDVAAGGICEVALDQLPDQCDDLGHGLGRLRLGIAARPRQ